MRIDSAACPPRLSGESRNPETFAAGCVPVPYHFWIPAFAGKTGSNRNFHSPMWPQQAIRRCHENRFRSLPSPSFRRKPESRNVCRRLRSCSIPFLDSGLRRKDGAGCLLEKALGAYGFRPPFFNGAGFAGTTGPGQRKLQPQNPLHVLPQNRFLLFPGQTFQAQHPRNGPVLGPCRRANRCRTAPGRCPPCQSGNAGRPRCKRCCRNRTA